MAARCVSRLTACMRSSISRLEVAAVVPVNALAGVNILVLSAAAISGEESVTVTAPAAAITRAAAPTAVGADGSRGKTFLRGAFWRRAAARAGAGVLGRAAAGAGAGAGAGVLARAAAARVGPGVLARAAAAGEGAGAAVLTGAAAGGGGGEWTGAAAGAGAGAWTRAAAAGEGAGAGVWALRGRVRA